MPKAVSFQRAWRVTVSVLLLGWLAGPGLAQTLCGDTVTVVYGDTLSKIAERCNTTVAALVRANPTLTNPNVIPVGARLNIPMGDAESASKPPEPEEPHYKISITPDSGPPGTQVQLTAWGFQPYRLVQLGVGPWRSEYAIIQSARTDAEGMLAIQAQVPETAEDGAQWVFVATLPGDREEVVSEPFQVVQQTVAPKPSAGGTDNARTATVEVIGTLTDEGVECPALRADNGELYTLSGDLKGFNPGDRVYVQGRRVEMSFCMQGVTLAVKRIEKRQ